MIKTGILLTSITMFFLLIGYLVGGPTGMIVAFIFSLGMNFYSYWYSDKSILKFYNAIRIDDIELRDLNLNVENAKLRHYINEVRNICLNASLPFPKICVIEQDQPNAFATGRNPENAAICVSTGLLNLLSKDELAGVVAHEIAHIKNYDILTMTISATIAGSITMLLNFAMFFMNRRNVLVTLLLLLTAPIVASIINMTISRTREYIADRDGAILCGKPLALASALEKIAKRAHFVRNQKANENPATAHLFIISPFIGEKKMDNIFSTHPNTENRITKLRELADEIGDNSGRVKQTKASFIPNAGG